MNSLILKIDLMLMAAIIGVAIPTWNVIITIIKVEREAALARAEMRQRIEILEDRMDNVENKASGSSGFTDWRI
jgi:uncharacterized membrane protein